MPILNFFDYMGRTAFHCAAAQSQDTALASLA